MKKLKNESELVKKALQVGEQYAKNRGYASFDNTVASKHKVEAIYRLLVKDKLIQAAPTEQEDGPMMKHKLAIWISKHLPADDPLLK